MDFGDLVFFIIFIIIVVSNVLQQIRKKKKSSDAQPAETKTGWKKTIEDILKDIRVQMEQNAEPITGKPVGRGSGWEDILPAEIEKREIPKKTSAPQMTIPMRPKTVLEPAGREADFDELRGLGPEVEDRKERIARLREKKFFGGTKKPVLDLTDISVADDAGLSADDLKNAVIWHEIISPPLGLRDF